MFFLFFKIILSKLILASTPVIIEQNSINYSLIVLIIILITVITLFIIFKKIILNNLSYFFSKDFFTKRLRIFIHLSINFLFFIFSIILLYFGYTKSGDMIFGLIYVLFPLIISFSTFFVLFYIQQFNLLKSLNYFNIVYSLSYLLLIILTFILMLNIVDYSG